MDESAHYLKRELYDLIRRDDSIFEFLQLGSLDGIWYWDLEATEQEWLSPRFWEVLGFDPDTKQHLASEWQDLIFADDLEVVLANFRQHCADPTHPYDQVVRYRHRDGSTVWVRCRGLAIRDDTGTPTRLLGAHTDLTPLKRTEEELRKRTRELEAANRDLRSALDRVRALEEILPICAYCRKVRDDDDQWHAVEEYITRQTGSRFSQGICPDCATEVNASPDG